MRDQLGNVRHGLLHPATLALFACGALTQLFSYGELSQPLAACFWLHWPRPRALLVPSFDWDAINPYHTHMAGFRAVEGGYPVIRVAQTGLSALFDAKGRLLASRDARFSKVDGFLFELPLGPKG
ncbi:MAG: hypothetical protein U0229_15550 [Anaeromyxobacter sp.]